MLEHLEFARLLAVPVENIARLERTVVHHRDSAPHSEYDAILAGMLDVCRAYKQRLFGNLPLLRSALDNSTIDDEDKVALDDVLGKAGDTFFKLHEILLFVPRRESVPRELRSFCEGLFRPAFDIGKLSIILTSVFNAFEYSLDDAIKNLQAKDDVFTSKIPDPKTLPYGSVMELAVLDRDNPLAWVILAHEFGHFIDQTAKISELASDRVVVEKVDAVLPPELQRSYKRVCREFVADLTAYYLLGPSCIAPLINMSLCVGFSSPTPLKFNGCHPFATRRIKMITERAKQDGMNVTQLEPLFATLEEEQLRKVAKLLPEDQENRARLDTYFQKLFDVVNELILAELDQHGFRRFRADNLAKAELASEALAEGLPIGTARKYPDAEVARLIASSTHQEILSYGVHQKLEESPLTIAEVVSAAWFHRIKTVPAIVREAFAHDDAENAFAHVYRSITAQDELTRRSIDVIAFLEAHNGIAG